MASGWPPAQPEAGGAFSPDFPAQIWANKWDCESYVSEMPPQKSEPQKIRQPVESAPNRPPKAGKQES